MANEAQAPQIEILDKLPKSYSDAATVNAILQVQGMVTAGFSESDSVGFGHLNFPNYEKDLGGKYDSTGGQTAHVFEKAYFEALHGQPTIIFAMQTRQNASDEPIIARHNDPAKGDAVVVYLPFKIFAEAGIDANLIDANGLLPKEIAMANYKKLFPAIATAANEFLASNIADFPNKNVIIDGNYADGMQTALDMQEQLKQANHAGEVVTIGTFHTHGINKFVGQAKKQIQDNINSTDESIKFSADLLTTKQAFVDYLENLADVGVQTSDIPILTAKITEAGFEELNKEFSFTSRLSIEATDNIAKFSALMSVDNAMERKLHEWIEGADAETQVGFAINGYNSNVYNTQVLSDKNTQEVHDLVRPLLERAHRLNPDFAPIITDEQLEGTNFITACRPSSTKNSDGAINAFVEWALQNPHDAGNLILIGHAPENGAIPSAEQKKLIAQIATLDKLYPNLNIENRVLMLPSIRSDEIRTILQLEHAVGLAASLKEPWGIGAIELMASGVPLVASNKYAAALDVYENHAKASEDASKAKNSIVLFESPSSKDATADSSQTSFVAAMNEVSANYGVYKQRAQKLAPDIAENFQWEAMVNSYQALENRILNQKITPDILPNTIILQDVDGCITPNIHGENRRPHSESALLQAQIRLMQEQGGISVISTGRSLAQVQKDRLLNQHPIDYVISSVGCQIAMRDESGKLINNTDYETWLLTPPDSKEKFNEINVSSKIESATNLGFQMTKQNPENVQGNRCSFNVVADNSLTKEIIIKQLEPILGDDIDYKILPSLSANGKKWYVDIMPSKAGKDGAVQYLIEHVNVGREAKLENVIMWGDSGNDTPAMNPDNYAGMKAAFIAPANATDEMRAHLAKMTVNDNVFTYIPEKSDGFSAPTGGAGGIFQGAVNAIKHFSRSKEQELPTTELATNTVATDFALSAQRGTAI